MESRGDARAALLSLRDRVRLPVRIFGRKGCTRKPPGDAGVEVVILLFASVAHERYRDLPTEPDRIVERRRPMDQAIDLMVEEAKSVGAKGVVCVRLQTQEIMKGPSEVLCFGTAVTLDPDDRSSGERLSPS